MSNLGAVIIADFDRVETGFIHLDNCHSNSRSREYPSRRVGRHTHPSSVSSWGRGGGGGCQGNVEHASRLVHIVKEGKMYGELTKSLESSRSKGQS